jgi:hypothetical protein
MNSNFGTQGKFGNTSAFGNNYSVSTGLTTNNHSSFEGVSAFGTL